MSKPKRHTVTLFLAAIAAAYCSSNDATHGANLRQPLAPGSPQPVTVTRLATGAGSLTYQSGITESTRLVVRDAAAWAETWARIWHGQQPPPALPTVDFSREMVVVAALGTRSSGGHSIVVESANQEGGAVNILIRTEAPGSNCMSTMALTAPVDAARVPKTEGEVRFEEKNVTRPC